MTLKRKSRGYWTEENTIIELELTIKELGHFPTQLELIKIKRYDLVNAINRNHGLNYFRKLLGHKPLKPLKKPNGYWTEELVISELELIVENLLHFPIRKELKNMNRYDLITAISKHGGYNYFREKMGYKKIRKRNHWKKEIIINELKLIIKNINHFPTAKELGNMKRSDLSSAIIHHGGFNYFRKLLGCEITRKSPGYWTEETIITELEPIIKKLNCFPSQEELKKINKQDLIGAISKHGGINYFRKLLGYEPLQKPRGYWTEENTLIELEIIINKLGRFPNTNELCKMKKNSLSIAILKYGGINHFRELLKYEIIQKPRGYWTEENTFIELEIVIDELGHFPLIDELYEMKRNDLQGAITKHGGLAHFWKVFGIDITEKQKARGALMSYIGKRGSNSEKIVKELITKWCQIHDLPKPKFNVKLTSGNVIEFVCETNKKIGIDVTNTKDKSGRPIRNKWKHKEYHLHLDELWIVVFSDIYTDFDYIKFNTQSPNNVKVMSIETFMEELRISVDDNLQLKIDNYNTCTFHNKNELIIPKQGLGKYFKIKPDIRIKT